MIKVNEMEYGEIYTEQFSHFNTTLIEENKNNNSEISELINNASSHFIDYLYTKRKIRTYDWTIKFNDQNSGLLIVGDLPDE